MKNFAKAKIAVVVCLAVLLMLIGYSYFIEPQMLEVNQYELEIANWDPEFDGLRIAMIADVHAGSNGADLDKLKRIVTETNRQDVDMIVLLGDYVSRDFSDPSKLAMSPDEMATALSGMRAKYGVFVVLGNHDDAYNGRAVADAFSRVGYRVLNGELAVIRENGGHVIRILGLKDHMNIGIWKNYSIEASRLLASTEGNGGVIVLQHSPDVFPIITGELSISRDLRLMLSGHTHGGQVKLPIIGTPIVPSSYGQKFARGHVKAGGLDIFITSGIGTSILPFRFMVPPEIAIIIVRTPKPGL